MCYDAICLAFNLASVIDGSYSCKKGGDSERYIVRSNYNEEVGVVTSTTEISS